MLFRSGWCSTIIKVEDIPTGADTISGVDLYTDDTVSFTFEEASIARAMGYFEILYRENPTTKEYEPYGVHKEQQVKVAVYTKEEDPAATPAAPATSATVGVGGTPPGTVSPRFGVGPAPTPAVATPPTTTSAAPDAYTGTQEEIEEQMAADDKSVDDLVANANTTDPEILKAILQAHNKPIVATGPAVPARRKTPEASEPDSSNSSSEEEPSNGS